MKAAAIFTPSPIETNPLKLIDLDTPAAGKGEVLVRVLACGVCRTDLHVSEGDLPPRHPRIVPGHEVVGVVERCGEDATRFKIGERVGIAWLRQTCGTCVYCLRGNENLCPNARFTGYDHDGGYAEYAVVREDFAYSLPQGLGVEETAPLLCAGIIGFRAMKRAGSQAGYNGRALWLWRFGAYRAAGGEVLGMQGVRDDARRQASRFRQGNRRRLGRDGP